MGFCLFEDADAQGVFFAVNSSYVEEIEGEADTAQPTCKLDFSAPLLHEGVPLSVRVCGDADAVELILRGAAKIGLNRAHLNLMNKLSTRPIPLLLNDTDRIMLVRELLPEEFMDENASLITASRLYLSDGKHRFISERPGQFVSLTNAGGKTPILKKDA